MDKTPFYTIALALLALITLSDLYYGNIHLTRRMGIPKRMRTLFTIADAVIFTASLLMIAFLYI